MELLDRNYQKELLLRLSEDYPTVLPVARTFGEGDSRKRDYNLAYLEEHEMVSCKWAQSMSSRKQAIAAQITAKGIDFITDDGGLSAILGVVTVRLHEDTLRALLIRQVEGAEGDKTVKAQLVDKIKGLPAEALGTVVTGVLEQGLEHVPNLIESLRALLHL